ncbi:MAG: hypothetical protein II493_05420, partial [Spirochaetales bacterium]|nr:hypothetical protein [Spirochaetales bacterium]
QRIAPGCNLRVIKIVDTSQTHFLREYVPNIWPFSIVMALRDESTYLLIVNNHGIIPFGLDE